MITKIDKVLKGEKRSRFISNSTGLPSKMVTSTPFIGTRSREGSIERGLGIEYLEGNAGRTELGHIFVALETSNPKEYMRALNILNRMERIDPDILGSCAHAGKKRVGRDDHSFHMVMKYQPEQIEVILEKRAIVFEQPLDQDSLIAVVNGFLKYGFHISNTLDQKKNLGVHSSLDINTRTQPKKTSSAPTAM